MHYNVQLFQSNKIAPFSPISWVSFTWFRIIQFPPALTDSPICRELSIIAIIAYFFYISTYELHNLFNLGSIYFILMDNICVEYLHWCLILLLIPKQFFDHIQLFKWIFRSLEAGFNYIIMLHMSILHLYFIQHVDSFKWLCTLFPYCTLVMHKNVCL